MTQPLEVLWRPTVAQAEESQISEWLRWLRANHLLEFSSYDEVWRWSISEIDTFWSSIWNHFGLIGEGSLKPAVVGSEVYGAQWFPGLRTNWAENVLHRTTDQIAVISKSQTRGTVELTGVELRTEVARVRAGLLHLGVGTGDRVVAYMPNISETLVLLLAAASLGAIFSSCPPEFGVKGVVDRFRQIDPVVLVACDGYRHRGKDIHRLDEVRSIRQDVPSIRSVVVLPYLQEEPVLEDSVTWSEFTAKGADYGFKRLAFSHPLYILYSSGTTGPPKPIVHGHGGVLIEHTKSHHLHHDLSESDRFFWFSTTGWVMWNYLVSGLLTGASIVLFDGDPGYPDLSALWSVVEDTDVTVLGTSAPFLLACRKSGLRPNKEHDLSQVRQVGSTGAPLPAEGFRWVYENVGSDLMLISASGGTDICGAFVAGVPILPVTAGEIACRCLGASVEAYGADGESLVNEEGELVITKPMPSMPVAFWGDHDGARYRAAYFDRFPGVWTHGDWITITDRGTCTISGRSDSTLNRGGVRLGTSDFYSVVDEFPEVNDSLVVHVEDPSGGVGELILFLHLEEPHVLDAALDRRIRVSLRTGLSPRHVPDTVLTVPAIPRTLSGKRLEVPIKRLFSGLEPRNVLSPDALLDPKAVDAFIAIARDRNAKNQ